jgi:hypothetical protein
VGHADFRLGGRLFASLSPDETWATLNLSPDDQEALVAELPEQFEPLSGAWGRRGWTKVRLQQARVASVRRGIAMALKWITEAAAKTKPRRRPSR